jgi:7,8-dihydroneopterin aldolase/epimerase/oxygenase
MSDQIFLKGLVVHARHGVMRYEGKVGQNFVIDIELTVDLQKAARSDRLADTVSYGTVAEFAARAFAAKACKLVEAAAGLVADALFAEFPAVSELRVTVHKPHAPVPATFSDVGVSLTRRRTL